jgi:hypothetical protein
MSTDTAEDGQREGAAETNGRVGARLAARGGPVAEVLVRSLSGTPISATDLRAVEPGMLHEASAWHRIAPAVFLALSQVTDDPELLGPLEAAHNQQVVRQLRSLADLRTAGRALTAAGVGWALLKGAAIAQRWPRPDMREYYDVDLLVDRRSFGTALDALVGAGSRMVDRNWPLVRDQVRAELTIELPFGTGLDLHWDLVNSAPLRREFRFPTEELLERASVVVVGNTEAPVLDPVDTLLHLGYHTTLSGGYRLLWLMDMASACRAEPDWDVVRTRARAYGVELPLRLALDRSARLFPLPAEATRPRTRCAAWRTVAAGADHIVPLPWVPDGRSTARIVHQNARSSAMRSLAPTFRDALRHRGRPADGSVNPLHLAVPDAAARAEYLSTVEASTKP